MIDNRNVEAIVARTASLFRMGFEWVTAVCTNIVGSRWFPSHSRVGLAVSKHRLTKTDCVILWVGGCMEKDGSTWTFQRKSVSGFCYFKVLDRRTSRATAGRAESEVDVVGTGKTGLLRCRAFGIVIGAFQIIAVENYHCRRLFRALN